MNSLLVPGLRMPSSSHFAGLRFCLDRLPCDNTPRVHEHKPLPADMASIAELISVSAQSFAKHGHA